MREETGIAFGGVEMSEWQPIPAYNGRYEISSSGEIKRNGKRLNPWRNYQGYMVVRLTDVSLNRREQIRVHRLVAEAFVPNPNAYPYVNHINSIRDDNRIENLEWCTQSMNLEHARKQGRMPNDHQKGKRSPVAKLTDQQAKQIREIYSQGSISCSKIGKEFGVSKHCIQRLVRGDTYPERMPLPEPPK